MYEPLKIDARKQWEDIRHMMPGDHPGCIEARSSGKFRLLQQGSCEFDGRLSLAYSEHLRTYLLYARANLATFGGSRAVQVATSKDLRRWSRFERVMIRGLTSGHTSSDGDTYYVRRKARMAARARTGRSKWKPSRVPSTAPLLRGVYRLPIFQASCLDLSELSPLSLLPLVLCLHGSFSSSLTRCTMAR